jgi:methylated-DNA-[protein]-cysteine S-methyltransferase
MITRASILEERDQVMETYYGYVDSQIGLIEIEGTREAITGLYFVDERRPGAVTSALLEEALDQVLDYFQGARRQFELPLALGGTDFQRAVWQYLVTIPFGETASYGEVAMAIGRPRAVRAVGAANGRNPVSIIVPCHRVVGCDGSLTGYGGGLWRKEWLLRHEGWAS